MITMRKETQFSITTKRISDNQIITITYNKRCNREDVTTESLFKYANRKHGYARLLELRDYEEAKDE